MDQDSQLQLIGRKRNLYKAASNEVVREAGDSLSFQNAPTTALPNNIQQPATSVAPGTVIQSAIWQTSGSDNRIQLTPDDNFTAFWNGNRYININSAGLDFIGFAITYGDYISGNALYTTELQGAYWSMNMPDPAQIFQFVRDGQIVNYIGIGPVETDVGIVSLPGNFFNLNSVNGIVLNGVPLGNYYRGYVTPAGTKLYGTSGYTVARISTGVYEVTFANPALAVTAANWVTVATAVTGHFRCRIDYPALNIIRFSFQQSNYGSQTFSVSGGGGGSVTVSGIYQGEAPVDTAFNFIASRSTI